MNDMNDYMPRRAGKRWRVGAPTYVLDCLDNKGKTADRYTVIFVPEYMQNRATAVVHYLGMSDAPTHPQGFSQWGEMSANACAEYRYTYGKERVRWLDLPEHIRNHVMQRYKQS